MLAGRSWLTDNGTCKEHQSTDVTIRCSIHLSRPRNSLCPLEYTDNNYVNKHNTGSLLIGSQRFCSCPTHEVHILVLIESRLLMSRLSIVPVAHGSVIYSIMHYCHVMILHLVSLGREAPGHICWGSIRTWTGILDVVGPRSICYVCQVVQGGDGQEIPYLAFS
jgi:hypothetical protein